MGAEVERTPEEMRQVNLAPHAVLKTSMEPPFPEGMLSIQLGMGCFWGAERALWQLKGVHTTACGYAGGHKESPTYKEVRAHTTGHTEVVLVVYDPKVLPTEELLKVFWESHDPTQGDRQHEDVGANYRSAIFCENDEQLELARASKEEYEASLATAGGETAKPITTEVAKGIKFWIAEEYHQQYLHKNPDGYCGLKGTGVSCPIIRRKKKTTPPASTSAPEPVTAAE